jgi:hypothetical protein
MIYKVEITETLSRIIDIEAISEDEAISKIKMEYKDEKIVLGAENFVGTEILVSNKSLKSDYR